MSTSRESLFVVWITARSLPDRLTLIEKTRDEALKRFGTSNSRVSDITNSSIGLLLAVADLTEAENTSFHAWFHKNIQPHGADFDYAAQPTIRV